MISIIWNAVLAVVAHSGVPIQVWCYCAVYVNFALNHLAHAVSCRQETQELMKSFVPFKDKLLPCKIVLDSGNYPDSNGEISFAFKDRLLPCKIVLDFGNYPQATAPIETISIFLIQEERGDMTLFL
jgi:hypothetical protein